MAEYSINWLDLLGDNPRIPADIHFKVVEKKVVEGRVDTSTEVFRAHKFVLAMFSDVFQAQFFGPMGNAEEEVLVEETSIAAFKEFLTIIYSLHRINRIRITIKDVELLYEILNLAKRYLVDGAIAVLEREMASMALTADEAITAAIIADNYKNLLGFEIVSEKLMKNCSAHLNASLTSLKKMRQFLTRAESEYPGETLKLILRLISDGADDSPDIDFSRSVDLTDLEACDDEAIQTLYCKHCNVKMHDLVSMESHLRGKPHLMQQKRLMDNQTRIAGGSQSPHNSGPSTGTSEFANTSRRFASPANLNTMSKPRPRSGSFDSDVWEGGYHNSGNNKSFYGNNKSFYGNRGLILTPPTKPFKPQTGLLLRPPSKN